MLEIGKLYCCEDYYLMLYPDKTTADAGAAAAHARPSSAAYWSRELSKPVYCVEKNIPLLILNSKGKYIEVLAGDKKGWIINEDFLYLKEIR